MTDDARSDADLLHAHAAGDSEAFGELVARHRDRLWAVALRTLRDREEAADALQDALVSAFRATRGGAGWRGDSAVTTWLHRIVVNACLDRVRRRTARPTDPLPERDVAERRDHLDSHLVGLDVDAALATLPVDQRAALVLVDMYGWPVEEAADVLGCAVGTVKSRCSRGRARLLPLLRDGNPRPPGDVPSPRPASGAATGPSPEPQVSTRPSPASTDQTPAGGEQQ